MRHAAEKGQHVLFGLVGLRWKAGAERTRMKRAARRVWFSGGREMGGGLLPGGGTRGKDPGRGCSWTRAGR